MVLQAHGGPAHRLSRIRAFCTAATAETGIRILTTTAHHAGRLEYLGLRANGCLGQGRGSLHSSRNRLLSWQAHASPQPILVTYGLRSDSVHKRV